MDAIALLRADHRKVLGVFDQLEGSPSVTTGATDEQLRTRGDLVTELVIAESQHEAVEEQYFWPAVRDALPNGDKLASHALDQEDEGKHVLQALEHAKPNEPVFEELLAKFITAGREHIDYEQNEVWPLVQATLSPHQLAELGEKIAEAKKTAPTRPHPHTPSHPAVQKAAGPAAGLVDKVRDAATGRGQ